MLTTRYKPVVNRVLRPIASLVVRTGIHPSTITLAGPILGSIACLIFLRTHSVLPFCATIIVVGCLDGLDGAVARMSGRETKFGGYLDAMADRYFEAIVAMTVAIVTGYWLISMMVLVGSLLVSYAKARAAIEVSVSNLEWPDLMERTERGILFIAGFAVSALTSWRPFGHDLFWWTLVILAILVHVTVVQRVLRARRIIEARGSG